MNLESEVLGILARLRRRLTGQLLLQASVRASFGAAGVLVLLAAVDRQKLIPFPSLDAAAALALLVLCWVTSRLWHGRPTLHQTAALVDRAAGTHDRLVTALEFSAREASPPRQRALAECVRYVQGRDLTASLPWRWPRELRWLWVPLVALALLHWDAHRASAERQEAAASSLAAVTPTISELQQMAQALQEQADADASEEMKKLAEKLQQSAERLREEAGQGADPERSSLRELSALGEMVRELQQQMRAQLTPQELKAMGEALAENEASREAGQKLQAGDAPGGAESLEKVAKELAERGDERTAKQIQTALKAALERLAQQRQLSESAQQMTRQGNPGEANAQMRRLAELLRKMPRQPGSPSGKPAGEMSPEALQRLLASLENLKQGQGNSGRAGEQSANSSQVLMQAFERQATQDQTGGDLMVPTGKAGGEKDVGTTPTPFGAKPYDLTEKGTDLPLQGQLGTGETASQSLPGATSDDAQARRKYRELYQAMAPAAEDAVQQENIPLGSRFFVKRYFEAIRPKD